MAFSFHAAGANNALSLLTDLIVEIGLWVTLHDLSNWKISLIF